MVAGWWLSTGRRQAEGLPQGGRAGIDLPLRWHPTPPPHPAAPAQTLYHLQRLKAARAAYDLDDVSQQDGDISHTLFSWLTLGALAMVTVAVLALQLQHGDGTA